MEAAPPSYEAATVVDPWALVAPFLDRKALLVVVRVCSSWHRTFTPYLWGNPAAHFREQFNSEKFLLLLPTVRNVVRRYIHTIYLPHALAEEAHHQAWLHDLLVQLDRLQALIVRSQPSLDHEALLTFRQAPSFTLRLLDVSYCRNATPVGLSDAFDKMQQLLYLDMSGTYAAKDHRVLRQLSRLAGLKVVKLRSVSLNDADFQVLAASVQTRVRSLDVRQNKLTDASARHLTELCYPADRRSRSSRMLQAYEASTFEASLRQALASQFSPRLAFEDGSDVGITHLYISDNRLSATGIAKLLAENQLHVLDAGFQGGTLTHNANTQALSKSGSEFLNTLRIDHSFVTETAPNRDHSADGSFYHPAMTKTVQVLVLTDFPSHSCDSKTVDGFITFLRSCANKTCQARREAAELEWSLPPGRRSAQCRQHMIHQLFALQTIVLEVTEPTKPKIQRAWSFADDEDCENFQRESDADFSFFTDDGPVDSRGRIPQTSPPAPVKPEQLIDNIGKLAAFRKERRAAFEQSRTASTGGSDVEVEGYWPGAIRVRIISGAEWATECYNAEVEDYHCRARRTHDLDRLG
ncbi:hypothetical protein K461DRAFT_218799 [Myriangium duriaei CBS 260.36]|uniref:Uncharacterized protein n=1 Tax=Myriangium duriaei CBS 260.36 TaxID=1168546 RepID=A0A9P4MLL7_9PEZI|nr:hypothetical protein K461DRAFT_218799 [Myriangium duriaei CBS 260.36]